MRLIIMDRICVCVSICVLMSCHSHVYSHVPTVQVHVGLEFQVPEYTMFQRVLCVDVLY